MAINYAEKFQRELDQLITQEALTTELETPNVNFLDARTFHVPNLSVSGYRPHSRNGGFNRGEVNVTHEPYTLQFDRDIEFFVDKADVDESNQAASAANVTRVFMREKGIPEVDAYRFSKLATVSKDEGTSIDEEIDKTNVLPRLKAGILPVRKYGPSNIIVYVSSAVMDALEQSESFNRKIDVTANGGSIETRVTSIDGVQLKEVWDEGRFYDVFDFTSGFVPDESAQKINFLVVAKPAVIAKAKISSIYLFQPGQHTQGDGYLYQNRIYHDLFKLKNKRDGVYASLVPTGVEA